MKKTSVLAIIVFSFLYHGCSVIEQATKVDYDETSSGLKYRKIKQGEKETPKKGDLITIHYIAKIEDGKVFDDTYKRESPLTFRLGRGHVIKGWEEGILLMSKGEKAEFVVPPELAYGEKGTDNVPPSSTVIFQIELIDIEKPEEPFKPDPEVFTSTPEGVKYTINERGKGPEIEKGMYVNVHYRGYFEDGEVFDDSYERDKPFKFLVGEGMVIKGWDIAFTKLRKGDKATLWVPYQLAYGKTGRGPIPPETNIMFDVNIIDVVKPKKPKPFVTEGKDTLETLSGIKYIIVEEGSDDIKPEENDVVVIHYTGYLQDGEIFDSSVKRNQPFKFVVGSHQVIPGWDKAIRLVGKGSKARFIIPPDQAYGDRQVGDIPPSSTLIFDVELIDINN